MALLRVSSLSLFLCNRPATGPKCAESTRANGYTESDHRTAVQESQAPFMCTLLDATEYAFYLPTIVYGPLVVYADWDDFVHQKKPKQFTRSLGRFRRLTLPHLIGRAIRLLAAAAFGTILTCTLYAKAILSYPMYLNMHSSKASLNPWHDRGIQVRSWTVWSCLHLAGISFYYFHTLIYGIPGLIADTEQYVIETVQGWQSEVRRQEIEREKAKWNGLSLCLVPGPPSCVFRITLFSEMWRTFDRGLYNFMFRQIYLPLRGDNTDRGNSSVLGSIPRLGRDFLAMAMPFLFVLLFHSVNKHNTVWIVINLIQFLVEKCFRWMDKNTDLGRKLKEPAWIHWRHRLLGVLHSVSLMTSLIGLIFFLFGYEVGMAFVKHIVFSYDIERRITHKGGKSQEELTGSICDKLDKPVSGTVTELEVNEADDR
ncbi:unnamed protein product [Echinostoma caproni]|uniref:MBOAT_2 domain-containing protein n=1 Tax=Echinostoma caproni TaxID=27848 RepID=A0A183ABD0_9TREM|nr:unnamed protein product [Echinostoma caproni]